MTFGVSIVSSIARAKGPGNGATRHTRGAVIHTPWEGETGRADDARLPGEPMPRFSANLSFLFGEHLFLERFAAAAGAGFAAVEYMFPYEHAAAEIRERLDDAGLATGAVQPARPATGLPATAGSPPTRRASRSSATASSWRCGTRRRSTCRA